MIKIALPWKARKDAEQSEQMVGATQTARTTGIEGAERPEKPPCIG